MPWARFAQQWGGANINVHRQDLVDTIEEERVEGALDDQATLAKSNTSKRDKAGVFRYGQTMRLGTNWGTTRDVDDGRLYEVKENDTFTWKQVPEAEGSRPAPRPLRPSDDDEEDDTSTLVAGEEDDDDDDGSSLDTTVPGRARSVGSARSVASSARSAPVRHEFMFPLADEDVGGVAVVPEAAVAIGGMPPPAPGPRRVSASRLAVRANQRPFYSSVKIPARRTQLSVKEGRRPAPYTALSASRSASRSTSRSASRSASASRSVASRSSSRARAPRRFYDEEFGPPRGRGWDETYDSYSDDDFHF